MSTSNSINQEPLDIEAFAKNGKPVPIIQVQCLKFVLTE